MTGSRTNPEGLLAELRRTRTPRGRSRIGRFSIEGLRLHERAVRSGAAVERAVVGESLSRALDERSQTLLRDLERSGCRICVVPDGWVRELTEGRSCGAIVGLVPFPPHSSLSALIEGGRASRPRIILVAVDVEDPGNVGALTRTALASGALALATVGVSDPYHPRAVRTSMGSLFKLPIVRYASAEPLLDDLASSSVRTFGAVSSGGVAPIEDPPSSDPSAIFLGSEAFGLPAGVRERLDGLLTIPMQHGVDSFSVNAVAAILLYEARRG
jgi:TrmH family RNA methyltransferase